MTVSAPTSKIRLAIDAMGGDHAPHIVIAGAAEARLRQEHLHCIFYGDAAVIKPLIAQYAILADSELVHTDQKIAACDKPSVALRNGRQSSMRMAIDAVANGQADGIVSAGNTGALMAIAKFVLKMLPGIDRPGIAGFFPTLKGEMVMLDLGGNTECDAKNLVDFAVMGGEFAKAILALPNPRIGILNVGSEEIKGRDDVREAAIILKTMPLPGEYIGFVEGNDIGKGEVDVVVTDGFTGNITLKTIEGTSKLFSEFLKRTLKTSFFGMLGAWLAKSSFERLKKQIDPRLYNGAMFVGLRGVCVKSHGGTDAMGFANAVTVACDLIKHQINDKISAQLSARQTTMPVTVTAAQDIAI